MQQPLIESLSITNGRLLLLTIRRYVMRLKDLVWQRVEQRFWAKVDKTDDCWIWTGCLSGNRRSTGQPQFRIANKTYYSHRVSWEMANGDIPEDLCVLHKCDVPQCVKPDHLFLGTQLDNIRDMVQKGRARGNNIKGEDHTLHKLVDANIREIRQLSVQRVPQRKIAKRYGVSQYVVWAIIHRRMWNHIV